MIVMPASLRISTWIRTPLTINQPPLLMSWKRLETKNSCRGLSKFGPLGPLGPLGQTVILGSQVCGPALLQEQYRSREALPHGKTETPGQNV